MVQVPFSVGVSVLGVHCTKCGALIPLVSEDQPDLLPFGSDGLIHVECGTCQSPAGYGAVKPFRIETATGGRRGRLL
jgi:hypothetical protein